MHTEVDAGKADQSSQEINGIDRFWIGFSKNQAKPGGDHKKVSGVRGHKPVLSAFVVILCAKPVEMQVLRQQSVMGRPVALNSFFDQVNRNGVRNDDSKHHEQKEK